MPGVPTSFACCSPRLPTSWWRRFVESAAGPELCKAQVSTIRLKLLKIGTVIVRNTRRIRFFISSAFPYRDTFVLAARRFASG